MNYSDAKLITGSENPKVFLCVPHRFSPELRLPDEINQAARDDLKLCILFSDRESAKRAVKQVERSHFGKSIRCESMLEDYFELEGKL